MTFPIATSAWRRLKLSLAELLVVGTIKQPQTTLQMSKALDVADRIGKFKNEYYPDPRTPQESEQ